MAQETKISKKKAFTLRLDRETVDLIDSLGETRTGKAQELIKIGLAHELNRGDMEENILGLKERMAKLEASQQGIRSETREIMNKLQEHSNMLEKIGSAIKQTREAVLKKIEEKSQKK